jgi:hypothetical protein
VATADESAVAGFDYTAFDKVVSFPAGVVRKSVTIPIIDDGDDEGVETFKVLLKATTGAARGTHRTAVVQIVSNDFAP